MCERLDAVENDVSEVQSYVLTGAGGGDEEEGEEEEDDDATASGADCAKKGCAIGEALLAPRFVANLGSRRPGTRPRAGPDARSGSASPGRDALRRPAVGDTRLRWQHNPLS